VALPSLRPVLVNGEIKTNFLEVSTFKTTRSMTSGWQERGELVIVEGKYVVLKPLSADFDLIRSSN
jgi:hypothetical protein